MSGNLELERASEPTKPMARERSRKRVVRRAERAWSVHEFSVEAGGCAVCRVAAVRGAGALLVWLGAGGAPALGAVALGMPGGGAPGERALASTLAGEGAAAESAAALARRLAARLQRPVHVCCGASFDRFTAPLLERALVAEIKSRPDCF